MDKGIKGLKITMVFVLILVVMISYVYANNKSISPNDTNNAFIPQVGGIDWNKPFDKNLTLENLYNKATNLPPNHTLCIPVSKFVCNANSCEKVEPKVFYFMGGSRSKPTISRCDSPGCDTFDTVINDSDAYKNIQPINPKGFVFKMPTTQLIKSLLRLPHSVWILISLMVIACMTLNTRSSI